MRLGNCIIEPLEQRLNLSAVPSIVGSIPDVYAPLASGVVSIHLPDTSRAVQTGSVAVSVNASADRNLSSADLLLAQATQTVTVSRKGATIAIPFSVPATVLRGEYFLIVDVQGSEAIVSGTAVSKHGVFLQPPVSDLAISAVAAPATPVLLSKLSALHRVAARVVNAGNVPVSTGGVVQFYLSETAELDGSDPLLGTAVFSAVALRPNQSILVTANVALPAGTAAGRYVVFAVLVPTTAAVDAVAANDVAASRQPLVVVKHLSKNNSATDVDDDDDTVSSYYDGADYYYGSKGEYGYADQNPTSQPAPTSMRVPRADQDGGGETNDESDDSDALDDDDGSGDDGSDDGDGGDDSDDAVRTVRITAATLPFAEPAIFW